MKKISLIISILFSSLAVNAQTGTGDDFESSTVPNLSNEWAANTPPNSVYELSLKEITDPAKPYNKYAYVDCKRSGLSYNGFTYTFSPINIEDAPYVSLKIRTASSFSLRIDLIDVNDRRTNQVTTKQTITSGSDYKDYIFDFTGRFTQSYTSSDGPSNGVVLATQIKRIEFIVNEGTSSVGSTFLLDSVMIGTRAKANIITGSKGIKLNQLGFFTDGPKKAVINGGIEGEFYVVTNNLSDTVYTGILSNATIWSHSNESVRIADFSSYNVPGIYRIRVPNVPTPSYPFTISETVLNKVSKASIKAFYYQRASTSLPQKYAGVWKRAAGHPDKQVRIHNSAVSPGRPKDFIISSPRGWYDAGDYNKYIVNSGISTYTLLAAYEHFSTYYDTINLNIPESSNAIPDILDEALYNIRWMLTMQDPYDGGVYHKLTNENFDGDVMPVQANDIRYVVKKGTAATLDFAAVMAQSARIYSEFATKLPGLSDSCLKAAEKAFDWAILNPNIAYIQSNISDPIIRTGEYPNGNFTDEFNWAAAELFLTTLKPQYYTRFNLATDAEIPSWPNVHTLGLISMGHNRVVMADYIPTKSDTTTIKNKIIDIANVYKNHSLESAYAIAMGAFNWNFGWGSNSTAANQSLVLIQAFNYTKDSSYLKAAVSNLDYLLGRNGLNYSFVTGYGSLSSKKPHHRVSQADGVVPPVPGFLVGGPNPSQEDNCLGYPSTARAMSYVDSECSYASNEIAINWNAPLAYITGAIQSIYSGIEPSKRDYISGLPTSTRDAVLKTIFIKVYPNPTSSMLNVEKPFELIAAPTVLDLNGVEHTISSDWSGNLIQINTTELQEGLYLIRLQGEDGAAVQKFTVMK